MTNIVKAAFGTTKLCMTRPLYQYDTGQVLQVSGVDLPAAYEVDFSTDGATSVTQIGTEDGVNIPDSLLALGADITAYIRLHATTTDGETVYKIVIPVRKRPEITDYDPSEQEQSAIAQAIAALNEAVTLTSEAVDAASEYADDARASSLEASQYAEQVKAYADAALEAQNAAESAAEHVDEQIDAARVYAENAAFSAAESAQSAEESYRSAERAEQAANKAGYLDVEIVDGRLIYTRTDAVDVDFELLDGHLIMGVI